MTMIAATLVAGSKLNSVKETYLESATNNK